MARNRRLFDAGRKEEFCLELARCGIVAQAARLIGVDRRTVTEHRKNDTAFLQEMEDAMDEFRGLLHKEALRRAIKGVDQAIFHRDEQVGTLTKYSDRMLELLLKRHDHSFRDHVKVDSTTALSGSLEISALSKELDELTEEERTEFRKILESRANGRAADS